MPGWSEVARFVHVSTYATWDDVARFYWGLVREQLRPTRGGAAHRRPASRRRRSRPRAAARTPGAAQRAPRRSRLARRTPAGGWDPATKRLLVAAVYGFVVSQTRYVGLEFGIHGYKPYRVDDVLRRRFGDCKDKASLMHALLEALGIDSRLVLLRMRRLGRIPGAPASLAVFNHAILWVPELDLFLDGTASWTGSRELPGGGPRRDRARREPGRPAALPRACPTRVPRRTGPRAASRSRLARGRPRDGARHLAHRRGAGAGVPARLPLRARAARAAREGVQPHLPGAARRGGQPLRPRADRGGRPDGLHARRAALRPAGRGRAPLHAVRRRRRATSRRTRRSPSAATRSSSGEPMENRFEYRYTLPAGWTRGGAARGRGGRGAGGGLRGAPPHRRVDARRLGARRRSGPGASRRSATPPSASSSPASIVPSPAASASRPRVAAARGAPMRGALPPGRSPRCSSPRRGLRRRPGRGRPAARAPRSTPWSCAATPPRRGRARPPSSQRQPARPLGAARGRAPRPPRAPTRARRPRSSSRSRPARPTTRSRLIALRRLAELAEESPAVARAIEAGLAPPLAARQASPGSPRTARGSPGSPPPRCSASTSASRGFAPRTAPSPPGPSPARSGVRRALDFVAPVPPTAASCPDAGRRRRSAARPRRPGRSRRPTGRSRSRASPSAATCSTSPPT